MIMVRLDRHANPGRAAENDRKYAVAENERAKSAREREAAAKVYSRLEFESLVVNCTQEQVIQKVGRPEKTTDLFFISQWFYRSRTMNSVTGKLDEEAIVVLERGLVTMVVYR